MSKRSFEAMSVVATGVESFEQRYGKRRRYDHNAPTMKQWRCNLTGLSQIHNLYFVAHGKRIYVYKPQFPTQAIKQNVQLIFSSQPSSPNLHGYLDQRSPHSINNLIVQFLGTEEVVAVVRDDGDVDAFLVRHVLQSIERRAEPGNTIGLEADEIKPFFQSNVGMTAWGLAIHTQARILATSSNAREVRVFKFGLLQGDDETADEEGGDLDDALSESGNKQEERKTDVTYQIINGQSNIPYISFCNTGDDPEGRWLLTTDISGVCRVMDIHKLRQVQVFRFGRAFIAPNSGGFDRLNAGWIITFLDRRSFEAEDDLQAALGMDEGATLPGIELNAKIWDLSQTVLGLPESSEAFVYNRRKVSERSERSPTVATQQEETMETVSSLDDEGSRHSESSEEGGGVEIEIEMSDPISEVDNDEANPDRDLTGDGEGQTHAQPDAIVDADTEEGGEVTIDWDSSSESDELPHSIDSDSDDSPALIDDGDDPDDEGTEDSISHTSWYSGGSIRANAPQFVIKDESLCDNLPCPILHASVRNIYLLQPSSQQHGSEPDVPPTVGIANPLRQAVQQDFAYLRVFERLNMVAHIPPLGVVVLASQKGRAIVLSLTKIAGNPAHYPPEMQNLAHKTNYGMRVECILPFSHQEKANERPFAPLHGLAASPLQGSEGSKIENRRWRIMMMYQDHSVLSYEIRRKGRTRDSGIDVGALVV